jgi:integrase
VAPWASYLKVHILPAFGHLELRAITREQVKSFAAGLTLAPTTSRAVVRLLRAILADAVDSGRIIRNPAERVHAGANVERRADPMHVAMVAGKVPAIADAIAPRHRAAVLLMATTGLRLGECLALTTDRVDWLRHTIRIDRQLAKRQTVGVFAEPKTRAGVRSVPVPAEVTDMLAAHLAELPAGDHGLIFTTHSGRVMIRPVWSKAYRAACEAAGLDGLRFRSHDLRHVASSSLIASGLSVAAVQAVLGHSTPSETLDVYTHFWPTDEERTREAIGRASLGWLKVAR